MPEGVNICNPGFGASCALCCGSHNYLAGPDEVAVLFAKRTLKIREFNRDYIIRHMTASRSPMTGSYYYGPAPFIITLPPREAESRQCPFIGCTGDPGQIGCLLYPRAGYGSKVDCYQNYNSKVFVCDAGSSLKDDEILFAAQLTGDWYYYSILIHSKEYLRSIMKRFPDVTAISDKEYHDIKSELGKLFESDKRYIRMENYFA